MKTNVKENGNEHIIEVEGRLDTLTSPALQELLVDSVSKFKTTVLDFSALEYVSSAGLRTLLIGEKTAKNRGVSLIIRHVPDSVREVLFMTGFTKILTIE
ncbi:MAG: STAS domain-containing protein [Clostridiales Family XIII bacterium]|nr:STAS domain-containing protein [Clostridiales Family XIII bacterium]